MSELKQYHPNLRVFRIKHTQNGWIFVGDAPKEFAILQSEPKMQQGFGKNVKVSLPKSYHSADATKDTFWSLREYPVMLNWKISKSCLISTKSHILRLNE